MPTSHSTAHYLNSHWTLRRLALASVLPVLLLAEPALAGEPCCTIAAIDAARGIVTARDTATGRTFQFQADPRDFGSLRVGDAVTADLEAGRVTGVGNATRNHVVVEPDGAQPCCDVMSIEPAPADPINELEADSAEPISEFEPVNGIVTARNNLTGQTFQFQVPAALRSRIAVGQALSMDASGQWASVQSSAASAGSRGRPATYSFAIRPAAGQPAASARRDTPAPQVRPQRWEIRPNPELRGAMGQIVVGFPVSADAGRSRVELFEVGAQQYITFEYGSTSFPLLEGEYDVAINGLRLARVPVQRGMNTRILLGTIRFNSPSRTRYEVFNAAQPAALCWSYDPFVCGLPAGEYFISVGGSGRRSVQVADGQVIDF